MEFWRVEIQTGADSYERVWCGNKKEAQLAKERLEHCAYDPYGEPVKAEMNLVLIPSTPLGMLLWLNETVKEK